MYLLDVQMPVTHQFSTEKQDGNLMAVTHPCVCAGIDVEHIDSVSADRGQGGKRVQHLLAQPAAGAGVHEEARQLTVHQVSGEGVLDRRRI